MKQPKRATKAPISTTEIRKRLTAFSANWKGAISEKSDAQIFTYLLMKCYGLSEHQYLREDKVPKLNGSTGFMDGFIPGKLIIEFKSFGKSLEKAAAQAEEYHWGISPEQQPRFILLCDFETFVLIDLTQHRFHTWTLNELARNADKLRFIIDDEAPEIIEERDADRKAAYQLAKLHQGLIDSNFKGRPLEIFLTRLLFCLFADDTGMFGDNGRMLSFLNGSRGDGDDLGPRISKFFQTLDKQPFERQTNLDDAYNQFPYVNGNLFSEFSEVPSFDSDLRKILIECAELDWKLISPAIFGAMFQGVLEEEDGEGKKGKRRDLGAHYTSERNILRVINPLFMDDLREELKLAGKDQRKLEALQGKLSTINLFDPACGCGNFLVIAYRELRNLELQIIEILHRPKNSAQHGFLSIAEYAKVTPDQLHGIEIEESAAHIARVAILITDHQINEQSRHIGQPRPTIPLGKLPNIVNENALKLDWESVLDPEACTYIIGNPPFIGAKLLSMEQRADVASVFNGIDGAGLLDFVAAWYVKAALFCSSKTRIAFVSTNSITQGEQVSALWVWLLAKGFHINFAHRTFRWSNEAKGIAAVHCVIVGWGRNSTSSKRLFDYYDATDNPTEIVANNINPYLVDAPNVLLQNRGSAICMAPKIGIGNKPIDGGNYLFTTEEKLNFIKDEPLSERWFRRWLGSNEFINGHERWCLWLGDCPPAILRQMPESMKRVEAVRSLRKASQSAPTRKLADTPTRFHVENIQTESFLIIPEVSSERRLFIPIGFISSDTLCSNLVKIVTGATLYDFGIITSTMHMAWTRAVCGRLKSDYRYSSGIVYNNFPWPVDATETHKVAIAKAAQGILDTRALFPESTLADLYDPLSMPVALVKAHQTLDKAVDAAYMPSGGKRSWATEAERVAFLFEQYQRLTSLLPTEKTSKKSAK